MSINKLTLPNNPSYKEGSLLSSVETANGLIASEFTFTRASSAISKKRDGYHKLGENIPRIESGGKLLLEPTRTNLLTYSNDFADASWGVVSGGAGSAPIITPNYGNSPEGVNNATRLQLDLNGGVGDSDRSGIQASAGSVTNRATTCKTIWIKSNDSNIYDLILMEATGGSNTGELVKALPNVWTRVSNIGTVTGTQTRLALSLDNRFGVSVSNTADVLIYGAQLEEGSYPTSNINTSGATATRLADRCFNDNLGNVINGSEGTLFFDGVFIGEDTNRRISISDGTNSNFIQFGLNINNNTQVSVTAGGVAQLDVFNNSGFVWGQSSKFAFAYAENDFRVYIDGLLFASSNSGITFPDGVLDTLSFARYDGMSNVFTGTVSSLSCYPTALSDTECIELTKK